MDARNLLNLLNVAIFGVLFVLATMVGYTYLRPSVYRPVPSAGLATAAATAAVPPAVGRGKKLWNENGCGSCHAKNMTTALTGPALKGVADRWSAFPRTDLYAWVRNSSALVDSGHERAVAVWEENGRSRMSAYPHLTDDDVEDLLAFIGSK